MYLAKFTNKNFFSNETISGEGVKSFSSINGFKDYSSPKLENFTYNPETFGYYKTFTSGREVKMCVDQSLFMGYVSGNFRSQPRVDISCVESQAKELFPDIVEAGINVVRNFIPNLQINLTVNSKTGQVSGDIIHTTDAEYPNSIGYGGDVNFWINGKLSTTAFTASNGKFAGTLSGLKNGDKVIAKIEFADITVSSEELKVNMNALTILNMGDFTVRAELVWNTKWAGYDRDQFSDWKFTSANASISATNVSIGKTTYCQPHSVEIFTVTFNPSTQKVESFHIKATIMSSDGMNKDVYDISLKGTASNAVWYTSGGCDLMNLGYTDMLSKVNYSEIRYKLTPINDGSGTSEWIVSSTIDATGLKSSDGMGHATGIRFYSTTTK
jgi:hypothetical protein